MARNVWAAHDLIWQLFKRDLFGQYKKSFVGCAWLVIWPLLEIVMWVFLQKASILTPGPTPIPYPVYVFAGLAMWSLFVGFYHSACNTLGAGGALLLQVRYPHEALLVQQAALALVNFTIRFILLLPLMLLFGAAPCWQTLLLPLVALPLFFLGAALGLVVGMIHVVVVDIKPVVDFCVSLLMLSTPLVYTSSIASPGVQRLIAWNPLSYLVCSCRDIVITGRLYDPLGYGVCAALSLVVFLAALRFFYVSEKKLLERMV